MRCSTLRNLLFSLASGVIVLAAPAGSAQDIQVVTYTNTLWYYNDSATAANNPGTAWKEPGFVPVVGSGENQWKANGKGLFGNDTSPLYNEPNDPFRGGILGFATPLDRNIDGAAARITFYFITKFDWPYDPAGVILRGTNYLDDGAIVYLNGVEVFRARVPGTAGVPPDWTQLADNQGNEGIPEPLEYSATSLVQGENVLAVEVHQSSAGSSDVAFATALRAVIPFAPVITSVNEPADRAVIENRTTVLSITGDGSPRPSYQWYVDEIPIPGATESSYTIPSMTETDAGVYKVILSNEFGSASSREAHVTYVEDVEPPVVVSAEANSSFSEIVIRFDEVVSVSTTEDLFGYEVTDGPNLPGILSATPMADGKGVVLGLDASLMEDSVYTVAVKSPGDLEDNFIAPGTKVSVRTWKVVPGFVTFETYDTPESGVEISKLTTAPSFPNSPRETFYITSLDTRKAYPDDSHEQYGGRLTGVFIPPTSGNWILYLSSDDSSELYFNPAGRDAAGKTLATAETACCNGFASHPTAPQALTAGVAYYLEAIYKEGGGGDYCRVAAKLESDPADPNTLPPIPAAWLGTFVKPTGIGLAITKEPVSQTASQSTPATTVSLEDFNGNDGGFSVVNGIEGANPAGPTEQWLYDSARGSWSANGGTGVKNTSLSSPFLSVTAAGTVSVTFSHRYNFEKDTVNWDGGVVRVSVNRGPYTTVPYTSITGDTYATDRTIGGNSPPLNGQYGYNGQSPDFVGGTFVTSTADLGAFNAGDIISVQFLAAWDEGTVATPAPNWEMNSVEFSPPLENTSADGSVTFTVEASATLNDAPTAPYYQWQRNNGSGFFDIPGATSASYSVLPTVRDDGVVLRCLVTSPGASATSAEVTLSVAPRLAVVLSGDSVAISWPTASTGYALQEAGVLAVSGATTWSPVGIAPTVSGGMNTVTISGAGVGQKFYRLSK